jgi:Cd2+/Zn2+-exporting ATPase
MIGRFRTQGALKELFSFKEVFRVIIAGILAIIGYILYTGEETYTDIGLILILISVTVNGIPIVIGAINGLIKKQVNVDELVSIAIIASLISGHYFEAAFVSFIMVFGSLIEEATSQSARKTISSLVQLSPKQANVVVGKTIKTKKISEIEIGDIILVKPGEGIPVDAIIVNGLTSVDESSITGEPIPNEKQEDDEVFAGTLNLNGVIKIKATKIGEDTTLGKVIQLVSEAEKYKPESISIINRYARFFTPTILLCSAITYLITQNVDNAITVLIVGCPCALILAVPTAIVASISRAAKDGVLVKGGDFIEKSAQIDTILFDKTGTLTEGNPVVDEIIPVSSDVSKNSILQQVACVEQNSTHPLSRAVINAAKELELNINPAKDVNTEFGIGVRGCVEGDIIEIGNVYIGGGTKKLPKNLQDSLKSIKKRGTTPLIVFKNKQAIGIISVSDKVRVDAKKSILNLKKLKIKKIGILSGDHKKAVDIVGKNVGATEIWSELKPQQKLDKIKNLQTSGNKIMYVGDGVNDAPALLISEVGIAMGAKGTEVALETADIVLMNDDIDKIPFLVKLSSHTVRIIKLNIIFGLAFNAIAILASGSGHLTPITGAIFHNIGSVFVVILSASIRFGKYDIL